MTWREIRWPPVTAVGQAGGVQATTFTDALRFADAVWPVIEADPARCSILATVLDQAVGGHLRQAAIWFLITDDGRPVAAAMQTPPFNLFIAPVPDAARTPAIGALVGTLALAGRELPGVTAFSADADAFAAAWTRRTGLRQELTMGEVFYEISAPPAEQPAEVSGAARLATEADVPLTAGWLQSFNLELVPSRAAMDAEQAIRQRLAHGWLVLWENDGEPVSMAGVHPAAAGVSRIGPVYTPGWHRRRGYGAAVTLAATRLSFEQGARRCVLFADAANPTSNGIYQAIGYRQIGEAQMIGFR